MLRNENASHAEFLLRCQVSTCYESCNTGRHITLFSLSAKFTYFPRPPSAYQVWSKMSCNSVVLIILLSVKTLCWGSSVSTVSDHALDDRAIGVRSPAGAKDFSCSLCVQTSSEAHPASCTMGTGGPFPGAKRGWGVTVTTLPHLVLRSRMSRSYTSPLKRHHGV
jgi:hypothetical protein